MLTTARIYYSAPGRYLGLAIPTFLHHIPVSWMADERGKWVEDGHLGWNSYHAIRSCAPSMPPLLVNPSVRPSVFESGWDKRQYPK